MFTGIIEEQAVVASLIQSSPNGKIVVASERVAASAKVGESVAVNGVCLTAVNIRGKFIEFDVSAETFKKSTLRDLKIGDKVNLEPALTLSKKLGGHMVTGHVDGVGEIRNIVKSGNGFDLYVSIPSELLCYLVPKGSIALDGVSLTVADFRQGLVVIAVIPLTLKSTTLGGRKIGDKVNIEVDILSKYIEKHLAKGTAGISEEMLTRVGLMPMGWIEN